MTMTIEINGTAISEQAEDTILAALRWFAHCERCTQGDPRTEHYRLIRDIALDKDEGALSRENQARALAALADSTGDQIAGR